MLYSPMEGHRATAPVRWADAGVVLDEGNGKFFLWKHGHQLANVDRHTAVE
jgi:hypothetical protein